MYKDMSERHGIQGKRVLLQDVWFRNEREGWGKGSACKASKARGIWTSPMGNEEQNRTRLGGFGSYKLWHWSRKQAGMGRGRKADLFGVCVKHRVYPTLSSPYSSQHSAFHIVGE